MNTLRQFIRESLGAEMDEKLLYDNGWYPLDDRLMMWAHPEVTDGEPIKRTEALRKIKGEYEPDPFPGIG